MHCLFRWTRSELRRLGALPLAGLLVANLQAAQSASPSLAPEPRLAALSLLEAQQIALERNWDLLAAAKGIDGAAALKIVAHEFPNPTLSLATSMISVDNHPNSTASGNGLWDRSYDTVVAINQLFEIGGKRRSRQISAQAGYDSARAQFYDAKRTLDLAVAKAYFAAAQSEEDVLILRDSAATLRQEASLAQARLKAGDISAADESQIEIGADRFELDARAAAAAAAQARIALEVLLGTSHPNGNTVLTDHLETLVATPPPQARGNGTWRPDVVAAEAAWRKAEADLRLQKAYRIPDPTVLAQYEHEPPDAINTLGVGVSFPLPLWNRNRGNILAASATAEQARLAYQKANAQAAAEIATATLSYDEANARWQRYRDTIRPQSEQVRKTKAYAYQKGGDSLLDMLVAERDDNEVRLAAIQAAADTAVALSSLKAATAEVTPSELKTSK